MLYRFGVIAEQTFAFHRIQVVVAENGTHKNFLALRQKCGSVPVVLRVFEGFAGVPLALFGDVYGNNVVAVGVDGGHCLAGGEYGYFMFGGTYLKVSGKSFS